MIVNETSMRSAPSIIISFPTARNGFGSSNLRQELCFPHHWAGVTALLEAEDPEARPWLTKSPDLKPTEHTPDQMQRAFAKGEDSLLTWINYICCGSA